MNFKFLAIFFIGLLTVNVSVQSPTLKDDSIKVIVVDVLNKILGAATTALNDVKALVDDAEKDQEKIKDNIVAYIVRISKEANSLALKQIDKLRDGATEDGNAVIDCIDAEQGKFEDAFTKAYGGIGTCAVGEAPKVIAEVKHILSQLTDLKDDVQAQTNDLSSCSKDELTCLLGFASTIVETAKKIPSIAETDIKEIVALIKTIAGEIKGCTDDVGKEFGSALQDIFNEAVVCIKK